jgi:hypothetical protein
MWFLTHRHYHWPISQPLPRVWVLRVKHGIACTACMHDVPALGLYDGTHACKGKTGVSELGQRACSGLALRSRYQMVYHTTSRAKQATMSALRPIVITKSKNMQVGPDFAV